MTTLDALVIGAGPTGLMAAIELARHGLSVRIIDKSPAPSVHSKALAIQARTLEIFHHLGIVDRFLQKGVKLHGSRMMSQGKLLAHLTFDAIDSPYPFLLSLEQSETERILADHLATFHVEIEREKELLSFEQDASSVQAILHDIKSRETETLRASWILGCDGCHSLIRKGLELPFKGKALAGIFSLADVQIEWDYPTDEFIGFWDTNGIIAAIPLPQKKQYRLIFLLNRCQKALSQEVHGEIDLRALPPPTLEETESLLQVHAGATVKIKNPIWLTNFHVHSRLIDPFQKRRIFLAGDAAHIHSPAGGQGMNTGIQDAFNLAWKLALVHTKKANPKCLETYTTERHSVAKKILRATEGTSNVTTIKNPLLIQMRNWIFSHLLSLKPLQRKIAQAISQTTFQYPKSRLILPSCLKGGPHVGMRAPNVLNLFSLLRQTTHHHLLLFSGLNPSNDQIVNMKTFARKIETMFDKELTTIFIVHGNSQEGCLSDPTGSAHQKYKAVHPSYYLLRPDFHIACKGSLSDSKVIEKYHRNLFS